MGSRRSRLLAVLALGILPGLGLGTGVGWSVAMLTSSQAISSNTFTTASSFGSTGPSAASIGCTNGAANVGRIEAGDRCVFTFSSGIATASVLGGWTGASTNVVVRFTNNASADSFSVWNAANSAQLPLGSVTFNDDYVTSAVTAGAGGTASTMVYNASTFTITITLGTVSGSLNTVNGNRTATWAPSATVTDGTGTAMSTTPVTGPNQKQF